MVEDVIIKLGLDARPVSQALRGVKGLFQNLKSDLGGMFKGLGGMAGGAMAGAAGAVVAAFAKATHDAIEYAHEIKDLNEETGIGVESLQAFARIVSKTGGDAETANAGLQRFTVKIGEARSGSEDAQQAFEKLGISLKDSNGHSKSTETILKEVADKIKAIEDPTLRAQIAFDLFGRSGIKLVGALKEGAKGLEDFKKAHGGSLLSEAEIERLDRMGRVVPGLWANFKNIVGKGVVALSTTFMGDANTDLRDKKFNESQSPAVSPTELEHRAENAKKAAQALERLDKLRLDRAHANMAETEKLNALTQECKEIITQIHAAEDGSLEQTEARIKLLEKDKEILEAQNKIAKDKNEAQEKLNRKKEHELDVQKQIKEATAQYGDAAADLQAQKGDRNHFTLEEMAGIGIDRDTTSEMANQIVTARQIQRGEAYARQLAAHGYGDQANELLSRTDEMRKGLTGLTDKDRNPWANAEKSLSKMDENIAELVRKAASEGIKIQPTMGK